MKRNVRSYGNYDEDAVSSETALSMTRVDPETGELFEDVGYTQQEFAAESDINEIVRRFGLTGQLPDVWNAPQSGDFVDAVDFTTAMQAVRKAEEAFEDLPADLRKRFGHDPQELMNFLENGDNRAEAMKLGLIKVPEAPVRTTMDAIDELSKKMHPDAK